MRNILPGRPQRSRQALTTINWDGLRIVAYISGTTLVVFNGRRELLQSISIDDTDALRCVSAQEPSGLIALSDKTTVYIYHPVGRDYGDLHWARLHTLKFANGADIACISWAYSDELLVAGQYVALWSFADDASPQVIWQADVSSPVRIAMLSPDAGLIASCGDHDRVVKIWRRLSYEQESTRFDVSYLSHPSTVTNLSWRKSWHQEQNIDNLLYSFCADNQIRVWAHSDHYAYTTLQKIITIDANISIQPRRLSTGSMSKSRFAFILESRDLGRAMERALQLAPKGIDHALEHLIEIANRAPEVCMILDGRGHMSAWGIENAGLRNKLQPNKFNLSLVDGVDITLPSQDRLDEYAQIYAFANNDASASLCVLVHLHSGQIDWYQGNFVEFFDTSARPERIRLMSCWSGHDSVIDRMISSIDCQAFLSLTERDHAILWSLSGNGAPVRTSELLAQSSILDATLLGDGQFAILVHIDECVLWDLRYRGAKVLSRCSLQGSEPRSVAQAKAVQPQGQCYNVCILCEDALNIYTVQPPASTETTCVNGHHQLLSATSHLPLPKSAMRGCLELSAQSDRAQDSGLSHMYSWSDEGLVRVWPLLSNALHGLQVTESLTNLNVRPSSLAQLLDGERLAIVHSNNQTLSIWSMEQGCYEYVHTFKNLDEIQDLKWHCADGNSFLLAVQFTFHFAIIAQRNLETKEDMFAWKLLHVVQTRRYATHPVGTLCWLHPCQLAVSLGSQIIIFDVRQPSESSADYIEISTHTTQSATGGKFFLQNVSLHLYDAPILDCFLSTGQYETALRVLQHLHQKLRFAVQEESIALNTEDSLYALRVSESHEARMNGEHKASDFDLEGSRAQLEDNIGKIPKYQLSDQGRAEICSLLDTLLHLQHSQQSLDHFALTYLYHFSKAMNKVTSPQTDIRPIPYGALVYASMSQTQGALLHLVLGQLEERDIKLTWPTARALGLFMFITDRAALKVHFEAVARAEYNRDPDNRNPVSCSLFYLALDKKPILQSLWRRTVGVKEKEQTMKILAHDFREQKWKATALKNAYALLSRRRFEYAAAFFLLGGSLRDAVNVCVNQLCDLQLAVAIARVWEGGDEQRQIVIDDLLEKMIRELAIDSIEARWMAIWTCIHKQDAARALRYAVMPTDVLFEAQYQSRKENESDEERRRNLPFKSQHYSVNEPTLLLDLYKQLRSKLIRENRWTAGVITLEDEWRFVLKCVKWYRRAGMDWLALQTVATWEFIDRQPVTEESSNASNMVAVDAEESRQTTALAGRLIPEAGAGLGGFGKHTAEETAKAKPAPTQFVEPSVDSLLDSFGF